jgi:hypothetical protein
MATDFRVSLPNRPGSLLQAAEALGHAGVNIEGACGYEAAETGVLHVLVADAELARRSLLNAGIAIEAERPVMVVEVENRPGSGAAIFRRLAEAGIALDLMYTTLDGRLVLGSRELARLRAELAGGTALADG